MKSLKNALLASTCCFLIGNSAFSDETTPLTQDTSVDTLQVQRPPAGVLQDPDKDFPFYSLKCCWLITPIVPGGDVIALGDGSSWRIDPEYLDEARTWQPGDALVLSPNYNSALYPSAYAYWFKNLRTNNYAAVNLKQEPREMGSFSHRVCHVDKENGVIFIENRVGFEVDRRDRWLSEEWDLNDHIIVGVSNVWFGSFEYILLNANLNHYVRAKLYK